MSVEVIGALAFVVTFALVFLGVHVGVAMSLIGVAGIVLLRGFSAALPVLSFGPFTTVSNYELAVLPLFILMGDLIFVSGVATKFFDAAYKWLSRVPGGLCQAVLATCTVLAATVGSGVASTAAVSRVAIPEMKKYRYDLGISAGTIASTGVLAILIPPSVILVFYSIVTGTSMGKTLMAGFIPGLWSALVYFLVIYVRARLTPHLMPLGPRFTFREKVSSLRGTWGAMMLIVFVLGGLYFGLFTPTEAAGAGALGALALALLSKESRSARAVTGAAWSATQVTAMIFFVIIGAYIFSRFLAITGVGTEVVQFIAEMEVPRWVKLAMVLAVYIILGCFIETISMLALTLPVVFPLMMLLGYDPVWLGIILVKMCEIGAISPPFGLTVYTVKAVLGREVAVETIFRNAFPYLLVELALVITLIVFPEIVMFLPNRMSGG